MELFYNITAKSNSAEIEFDDFETQHILKSKRKKIGDEISFTDGKGILYQGTIQKIKPRVKCTCQKVEEFPEYEKKITLAVGFIRPNRLDFLIEKITELGISKIILYSSQNGNYHTTNTERWIKIARQAIKQSVRFYLPKIETLNNFDLLINDCENYDKRFITDQYASSPISELDLTSFKDLIYIIGPEGGLTTKEIEKANKNGIISVKMGNYRLRTETAALAFGAIISTNIN